MKNSRIIVKIIASLVIVIALLALMFSCTWLLSACNKKVTLDDIYKSAYSEKELTRSKIEFTLPAGWEPTPTQNKRGQNNDYINSTKSDVGYIKDMDAFVVKCGDTLSIVKCNDDRVYNEDCPMPGMMFPLYVGINALRVKDGLIACRFNDGTAGVFDYNGRTVLSRSHFKQNSTTSINLDGIMKILDNNLIAVHANYLNDGASGYTSIYRPKHNKESESACGELVCRVANGDNVLSYVRGFDGKYVTVVGNDEGDCIYRIPSTANGNPQNMTGTSNGTFVSEGQKKYYCEITYMGGGKFFVHEDWVVDKTADYLYYDGYDYYCNSRHIYTPDNDRLTDYTANSNNVFAYLTNNYYDVDKAGIDTSAYLNDGFTYASYGLTIIDRVGFYDQFILDKNFNVVRSLTGNYGIEIKGQKKEKVGVYDLIMTKVDGYFYVPLFPSEINIFDAKGSLVGHNDRTTVRQQELSNGVIVAAIEDPNDDDENLYIAFNYKGEEITKYKYTSLSAFRGSYSIGERIDEKGNKITCIIGLDGTEVTKVSDGATPLADMALTSGKSPIYKIGCYMFKEDRDGKTYYGVKNFNPKVESNLVMAATMSSGTVLYSPSDYPEDVFVFEKIGDGDTATYTLHRLI